MKNTMILCAALAVLSACNDDPGAPSVAHVEIVKPFEEAAVGTRVDVVARVTDEAGSARAGVVVNFSTQPGDVEVTPGFTRTDGNGVAVASVDLPTDITLIHIFAEADGVQSIGWRIFTRPGLSSTLSIAPDTLRLKAGTSATVLVEGHDRYGNSAFPNVTFESADSSIALPVGPFPPYDGIQGGTPGRTMIYARALPYDFAFPQPLDSVVVIVEE